MSNESVLGFQWLYSVLANDSTLSSLAPGGVWRSLAPPSTMTPYVIMALQSGTDVTTMNAFRLLDNLLYQVKAVGPASIDTALANTASRIDTLIGGPTSGTVTGGVILSCYRQSPLENDELVNGELWHNIGGLYRIEIEQSQ